MRTQTPYRGTIVTLWPDEIETLAYIVRDSGAKLAIELGTYKGGSALVMINAGVNTLYTYDNRSIVEAVDERAVYRVADIFSTETTDEIKCLCATPEKKVLFCDNGNKKREINTFGPHLLPGDFLVAHDYQDEFQYGDISAMIGNNGYERMELPWNNRIIAWRKT